MGEISLDPPRMAEHDKDKMRKIFPGGGGDLKKIFFTA